MEPDILDFHTQCFREYLEFWYSAEERDEVGVSREEAAYHALEHAGMLQRYTGEDDSVRKVFSMPKAERKALTRYACAYIGHMSLTEKARRILSDNDYEADELELIEDILFQRDGLETVFFMLVGTVAKDFLREPDISGMLADTRCKIFDLDEVLLSRPDVYIIASRALESIKERIVIPLNEKDYWWFYKARTLDEDHEKETFADILLSIEREKMER